MEQLKELNNKILTLPKSDFPSLQQNDGSTTNNNDTSNPPLLLLTLPSSLQINDLSSSDFFISDDNDCRLVNESRGVTFDLVKVESSNAYVMFPPTKRHKITGSNTSNDDSNTLQGRLLRENNTFFMECEKPKVDLEQLLSDYLTENCTYPPSKGISILELSEKFKFSQTEVRQVLDKIHAFQIPTSQPLDKANSDSDTRFYGVLSEEVERDTWNVIISVLSEWEGGIDYSQKGVTLNDMIQVALAKDNSLEKGVLQYCLDQCIITNTNDTSERDRDIVQLDAEYIAKKLAHQLFNSRIAPWKQSHFISEWHRLMPGVGEAYEPNISALKGIAIAVKSISPVLQDQSHEKHESTDELYLKYFPKEALPNSDEGKFNMVFKEQSKWKWEELQPYFDESKFEELLLKYARRCEDDESNVWYEAKRS